MLGLPPPHGPQTPSPSPGRAGFPTATAAAAYCLEGALLTGPGPTSASPAEVLAGRLSRAASLHSTVRGETAPLPGAVGGARKVRREDREPPILARTCGEVVVLAAAPEPPGSLRKTRSPPRSLPRLGAPSPNSSTCFWGAKHRENSRACESLCVCAGEHALPHAGAHVLLGPGEISRGRQAGKFSEACCPAPRASKGASRDVGKRLPVFIYPGASPVSRNARPVSS